MGQFTIPSPNYPGTPHTPYKQFFSPLSPRSPRLWDSRKEDSDESEVTVTVTTFEKCCNFLGCIAAAAAYFALLLYSNHLWTIDTALSLVLAEYCGWSNEKLRRKSTGKEEQPSIKADNLSIAEKGDYFPFAVNFPNPKLDCIAAVVGYREDPAIFTKALESYQHANGCRFVLTCIDGNGLEDQEMVDVFQKVDIIPHQLSLTHH